MTLNEYQEFAISTAIYPATRAMDYLTNALTSEAGEVSGKYAKIIRDKNGIISDDDKIEIIKEVSDVLWNVANIASALGTTLDHVAATNIEKLKSRQARGVLGGSGDNR